MCIADISIFRRVETGVGGGQKETIGKRIPAFNILSLLISLGSRDTVGEAAENSLMGQERGLVMCRRGKAVGSFKGISSGVYGLD